MALLIDITVIPSSGRQKLLLDAHGRLKCYVKSAPEKGRANKELIKFFAKLLGYPQDDVELVAGATSRRKRLKIHRQLTYDQFIEAAGLAVQQKLF